MRWTRNTILLLLCLLMAGCTVRRHVQLDFPDPLFDFHCGPITLIALPSSTVLVWGHGTYLILRLPFYVPLLFVAVTTGLWLLRGYRKHAQEH